MSSSASHRRADDAVTTEVVRSALAVAAEEASMVVVRSSQSTFIQEGADACAALLDADGHLVAQSASTSLMHSASLRCSLPELLADIPGADMSPGDVYVMNDPYRGGIHANDLVVFEPIIVHGELLFFAGTLIHVSDLGGVVAGGLAAVATDTFQEGLLLPPVHLLRRGEPVQEIWKILARNSRTPDKVTGDVHALVAGVHVLSRRIGELCEQWGPGVVARVAAEWQAYAETRMRQEIAALPDGTWRGAYPIEGDGVEHGREFDVVVEVTVDGDRVIVDFEGTSPQARGAINSSYSQTLSGVIFAVRCFIDPTIPMNEGCLRPVEVRLPAGTLVNPTPPAACGGRVVTVSAAVEAILQALSGACPHLATAANGLIHVYTMTGAGEGGQPWVTLLYEFGGLGARTGSDGPDATGAFFLGGRSVIPQIEPLETSYPILVRHARLRPDSGGAGQWRGGLGTEMAIEVRVPATLTVRGDRMERPPSGRGGGLPGLPGFNAVLRADGTVEPLATKQANVALAAGDTFLLGTSGGGGLGDPHLRDPHQVSADIDDGRITAEAATLLYGVSADHDRSSDGRAAGGEGAGR